MSLPIYSNSIITAVGKALQGVAFPKFVIGGQGGPGGTSYELHKASTSYNFALFRSKKYLIGQRFKITEIRIPLSIALAANMTIIPVIHFDDEASSSPGTTIDSNNYPDSDKMIFLAPDNFSQGTIGQKNFYLELQFTGSALLGVNLPISIEYEIIPQL